MCEVAYKSRKAKKAWENKRSGGTLAEQVFKPKPRVAVQPTKRAVISVDSRVHAAQSNMMK